VKWLAWIEGWSAIVEKVANMPTSLKVGKKNYAGESPLVAACWVHLPDNATTDSAEVCDMVHDITDLD